MKKTLSILLGLLLCFSMVACKRDFGHTEKIDPKRTQLYVFNYDGGVGTEWLYDIKARFEDGILRLSIPKKDAQAVETKKTIAIEG